ncbi:MAG: protein-disulfide reductase DsbD domain-containing protein [Taibaiella sp.]|jgi:thiol:disulfide interchange protein DsbD
MKFFFAAIIAILFVPFSGKAQITPATSSNNPVHWTFSIKKMDTDVFRFEAKATLDKGYHVWAQDPGGDGSLIPTSFTAEQLQNGGWTGDWKEVEQPKIAKMDFIDGAVRWHEKTVTFYRDFKGKRGDKVKGAVQYQSCNDKMCFPPAIENFVVLVN